MDKRGERGAGQSSHEGGTWMEMELRLWEMKGRAKAFYEVLPKLPSNQTLGVEWGRNQVSPWKWWSNHPWKCSKSKENL